MINTSKLKEEYQKLSQYLSGEDVLKNRELYQQNAKRFSFLEKILAQVKTYEDSLKEKEHLERALADPAEDKDMKDMAREELEKITEKIKDLEEEVENKLFEENQPQRDIMIEIRAAAGGEESALFAASLFKMYSRYIETKGWKMEVMDSSPTEIGGYKEMIFSVQGHGAYAHLKFESGVHRVQRVPATEASGRIHTSTVTVAVLEEPQEVELKINPEELKIDTYRAGGAGGQHVNRTDSAVRLTHIPTGIVVCCQDERSQIKNRAKAMRVLKVRLLDKKQQDETNKLSKERRVQIGTGERSEKIRTYNYPERRVTDHRINFTLYRLEQILEGDLDELISKLIKEERQKLYEIKGLA